MSRIPTSLLVSEQLPEFIQENYSLFISFIEAYYEYLDSQINQDFKSIKDLDTIPDTFIQYIRNEIASLSSKFLGNERFILSHMRDLYRSKGSEASFKLIFKLLYNKDVDIKYPQTQMLRVSDGKWQQPYSIFVSNVSGDIYSLIGNIITIETSVVNIAIQVINVTSVTGSVYEVSINKDFYGDIQVGSIISFRSVTATIIPTTTNFKILNPGKNFKSGDLYSISSSGGSGTILKITKVDVNGSIISAQILLFGLNYANDFTIQIQSKTTSDLATVNFYVGAVAKYPGYYSSNDGFLDDNIFIQDSRYYQIFSYDIVVSEQLDSYKSILKTLIHPAGIALFGTYTIDNIFDISATVS